MIFPPDQILVVIGGKFSDYVSWMACADCPRSNLKSRGHCAPDFADVVRIPSGGKKAAAGRPQNFPRSRTFVKNQIQDRSERLKRREKLFVFRMFVVLEYYFDAFCEEDILFFQQINRRAERRDI